MQHPKKPLVRTPTAVDEIMDALSAPFERAEVKCRPGVVSGNRALALHFVDARVIQDRLDDVLGVTGWQDEYEVLADGSVVCKLRLRLGGEWITKMDVGSPSEQPDEGDRRKAAFSDALKRAAVKFGVGRYLYRVPQQWCDYDPAKRRFVRDPSIPDASLPKPKAVREASPSTVVKPVACARGRGEATGRPSEERRRAARPSVRPRRGAGEAGSVPTRRAGQARGAGGNQGGVRRRPCDLERSRHPARRRANARLRGARPQGSGVSASTRLAQRAVSPTRG